MSWTVMRPPIIVSSSCLLTTPSSTCFNSQKLLLSCCSNWACLLLWPLKKAFVETCNIEASIGGKLRVLCNACYKEWFRGCAENSHISLTMTLEWGLQKGSSKENKVWFCYKVLADITCKQSLPHFPAQSQLLSPCTSVLARWANFVGK